MVEALRDSSKFKQALVILVGCKSDEKRALGLRKETMVEFGRKWGFHGYVETSAKKDQNCFAVLGLVLDMMSIDRHWKNLGLSGKTQFAIPVVCT